LPIRSPQGGLSWPREGNGIYWSPEIRSAERLGATIERHAGWLYERCCDCRPLAWVEEGYRQRQKLGGKRGKILKLGLNALYGKQVQRVGVGTYQNIVYGGLITAGTRARINNAIAAWEPRDRKRVLMIATDGIFTQGKRLPVNVGDGLGQWELRRHPHLFIVQPGLYWGDRQVKSRGMSHKLFAPYTMEFEEVFARWAESCGRTAPPKVAVTARLFIGLRLAAARGKPETAGEWKDVTRKICFDWSNKRGVMHFTASRLGVRLDALPGSPSLHSQAYDPPSVAGPLDDDAVQMAMLSDLELDGILDTLDLTPPYLDE
jgi:hypothetical protein